METLSLRSDACALLLPLLFALSVVSYSARSEELEACSKGAPVKGVLREIQFYTEIAEMEQRVGVVRPETQVKINEARERLEQQYADAAASSFGLFLQPQCLQDYVSRRLGQLVQIEPAPGQEPGRVPSRFKVHMNGREISEPTGDEHAAVFWRFAPVFGPVVYPDQSLAQVIIQNSIESYEEPCPCPYSLDEAGGQCGDRSAYLRFGGAFPMCFASDVPPDRIATLRSILLEDIYFW